MGGAIPSLTSYREPLRRAARADTSVNPSRHSTFGGAGENTERHDLRVRWQDRLCSRAPEIERPRANSPNATRAQARYAAVCRGIHITSGPKHQLERRSEC